MKITTTLSVHALLLEMQNVDLTVQWSLFPPTADCWYRLYMQVIELLTLPASSDERLYNAAVSVRLSVCLSRR